MKIRYIEIQNFRKLLACRVDINEETSVFVGANNSGKTSAMDALILFLSRKEKISTTDFTLSNWLEINKIGERWSQNDFKEVLAIDEWEDYLPSLDIWIDVKENEIHYVRHLIPTLDWKGGSLGVRFRLEPVKLDEFFKDYKSSTSSAKETASNAKSDLKLWPSSMRDFLDRKLNHHFTVRSYTLDPSKCTSPKKGIAAPQKLSKALLPISTDPLKGLMKIDIINAQRGFSDPNSETGASDEIRIKGNLSSQLRDYYSKHLNPSDMPDGNDVEALKAIEEAQTAFDKKINERLNPAINELEGLGYPGFGDPKITISCKLKPIEGLNHSSAVQFDVIKNDGKEDFFLRLPEKYNGLGYQNLISMVFKLIRFRDEWMKVGKIEKKIESEEDAFVQPLHLVLVEEPEAHLHAQVQQVFIRKAYEVLRNHTALKVKDQFRTQLIVSTHSSHIAHEVDFSSLRYFQRNRAQENGKVPYSAVVNLSEIFGGKENETNKFATRYLQTTHSDLFFADAVILVEGPAERMLVPHFIRKKFKELNESYTSILEIGGSHAHRLRPLIESLGIATLIITDLDSIKDAESGTKVKPENGKGYQTGNDTLKTWVPCKNLLDEVQKVSFDNKISSEYPVRVAYQDRIKFSFKEKIEEIQPYTFEDSLILENISFFKDLEGNGLIKKVRKFISESADGDALASSLFEELKTARKAEFALEILYHKDPNDLNVPKYIADGLSWIQAYLKEKRDEHTIPLIDQKENEHESVQ